MAKGSSASGLTVKVRLSAEGKRKIIQNNIMLTFEKKKKIQKWPIECSNVECQTYDVVLKS